MSFPEIGLCHVPTWLELPRGYFDVQIKNIDRFKVMSTHLSPFSVLSLRKVTVNGYRDFTSLFRFAPF